MVKIKKILFYLYKVIDDWQHNIFSNLLIDYLNFSSWRDPWRNSWDICILKFRRIIGLGLAIESIMEINATHRYF